MERSSFDALDFKVKIEFDDAGKENDDVLMCSPGSSNFSMYDDH